MSSTIDLLQVDFLREVEVPIMVMMSCGHQGFLLSWCPSAQGLHFRPQLALGCQEDLIRHLLIDKVEELLLVCKKLEVPP